MLQTLNNNTSINNNNAMYINPKKKVLSKWCANHGLSPNTSMVVNTTTTTSSSIKIEDTTTNNHCTISNNFSLYSPTAPHLSFSPQSHIDNFSSSWNVVQRDEDYFKRNNCRLSTTISLTYSRDDSSCLAPQNGQIVLYSSLRYLLKHDFSLTSSNNSNLPQILFMRVELIGGTIKEKINGVISHSSEMSTASKKVFKADTRLQIEKVQSYKQAVHFKLSLFDLSDLEHAICVLESVSFNVFARKKQDGSVSPKVKKQRNVSTKRSMSPTDDHNEKLAKHPKVDAFSNNVSNTVSYAQSSTIVPTCASDMQLSVGSLSLLATVLTNPSNFLDEEEEPEHDLEIDDGEEPQVNHDTQLLCTYEHQLKELISHISLLSSEERVIALQSAIVALR